MDKGKGTLGIRQLPAPDEAERLGKGHGNDLDDLILVQPRRNALEIEGGKEVDPLIREPGSSKNRTQGLDPAGTLPRLLL